MIDENIGFKPYKKGDRLILEVIVTDEEKSFDFLGKAIMNRLDTKDLGFDVDKVSFWKERYIENIPLELRNDIVNKLQESVAEIEKILKK